MEEFKAMVDAAFHSTIYKGTTVVALILGSDEVSRQVAAVDHFFLSLSLSPETKYAGIQINKYTEAYQYFKDVYENFSVESYIIDVDRLSTPAAIFIGPIGMPLGLIAESEMDYINFKNEIKAVLGRLTVYPRVDGKSEDEEKEEKDPPACDEIKVRESLPTEDEPEEESPAELQQEPTLIRFRIKCVTRGNVRVKKVRRIIYLLNAVMKIKNQTIGAKKNLFRQLMKEKFQIRDHEIAFFRRINKGEERRKRKEFDIISFAVLLNFSSERWAVFFDIIPIMRT